MILIITISAVLILGFIKFFMYLFGWRKDFNYARGTLNIWYNADIVKSFQFHHGEEKEVLDCADKWIKENKERIEKYCK